MEQFEELREKILPVLLPCGVKRVALFGSVVRGEDSPRSDIDILVKFKNGITLLQLSGIKLKLEDKLGKKVDLLTYGGINPHLKDIILKEQKIIYEKRS